MTVAIRDESTGKAHKLTKIVPYSEGGFAVLAPYHAARSGLLEKCPVDYNKIGNVHIPASEIARYSVEDRVKLSYHADGSAQFSSEVQGNVVSGRDPKTGEFKGLGIRCQPIDNPVKTGPTFGVSAWGLHDFDLADETDSNTMIFGPEDVYYRGCTPDDANAWLVEFFVYENRYFAGVRRRAGRQVLSMSYYGFEASRAVIEHVVFQLPGQPSFIAAFSSRIKLKLNDAESGWRLNGPGERDQSGKGHVLFASYPPGIPVDSLPSLDRRGMSQPRPSTGTGSVSGDGVWRFLEE